MADRVRIGIVDDNELVTGALAAMLEEAGCQVQAVAHTSEAGWALVDDTSGCQVVFVDLVLDGASSGIELAKAAARNGRLVVVMTGGASLPDELSGAALLLKPFSAEQVRLVLHALRAQHGGGVAA